MKLVLFSLVQFREDNLPNHKQLSVRTRAPQFCWTPGFSPLGHPISPLWDSPSKNSGVGCHALLQGIILTQGSNPSLLHLLHWQADSLPLSHLGNLIQLDNPRYDNLASLDFLNSPYFMSFRITTMCLDFFIQKIRSLFITTCLSPHLPLVWQTLKSL